MMSRLPLALALALAATACADAGNEAQETGSDTAATAPAAQPAQTAAPSDAEIAHIAKTVNDAEIEGGNMASTKSTNAEVKSFAQLMIADHTAMNQQATQVTQSENLTPASNPISQQLMSEHQAAAQRLQGLRGAEFDRAYIADAVQMHQKVLNALDQTLIPNAQNGELKTVLSGARAKVEAHLNRARDIQGKLGQ